MGLGGGGVSEVGLDGGAGLGLGLGLGFGVLVVGVEVGIVVDEGVDGVGGVCCCCCGGCDDGAFLLQFLQKYYEATKRRGSTFEQ